MSSNKRDCLRKKPRISYYETEEPDQDEYLFCIECEDYVYEYCAIHGSLLIIPDDKVPNSIHTLVPRAAYTIPHVFLHIAPSNIQGAGLGIFSTLTLPADVRFGPYRGVLTDEPGSDYCWQIYNSARKPVHLVDGADVDKTNWMRYVNCARHYSEQNCIAFQYRGEIYYKTIRIIPRNSELLVFYGPQAARKLNVDLSKYNRREYAIAPYSVSQLPPTEKETDDNIKSITDAKEGLTPSNTARTEVSKGSVPPRTETSETQDTSDRVNNGLAVISKVADINNNNSKKTDNLPPGDGPSRTTTRVIDNTKFLNFKCSLCTFETVNSNAYERHQKLHDETRAHECHICKYRFTKAYKLILHLRTHSDDKPYVCSVCNYKTTSSGKLKVHKRIHTGEKPYECSVCEFKTTHSKNLKRHVSTHNGEKPYECNACNYKTGDSGRLKVHQRTHTGEKPYECSICNYKTTNSGTLKVHKRTHTEDKPYECNVCDFKTKRNKNLKCHVRIHTGEKPHECSICDYKTTTSGRLKEHLKTHTGEKPYQCDICHFRTHTKSILKQHIMSHIGLKPYKCHLCKYKCIAKTTLNKHLKSHARGNI